jgi:glycerol-3-phosphate dehydrogenase
MQRGKLLSDIPHAVIIGAGFTGCALAHDLTQRGFATTIVERGDIANGTSGRTHGLLHSGGRYCVSDREAAIECIDENITLRKIAKQCIEFNGGLFIALDDSDEAYGKIFSESAQACHIPIELIKPQEALRMEPGLNRLIRMAYSTPDGSFDPLRLAMAFAATARKNGASFLTFHEVTGLIMNGNGGVCGVKVLNRHEDKESELKGDIVINATGAWAGKITAFAGVSVPVTPTPGVMVAYNQRLIQRVVNRLNEPGDGDILIPQRRMVVIGTTSFEVEDVDYIPVVEDQVHEMYAKACKLVPGVSQTQMRGWYMSARPLISSALKGRSLTRSFHCYDHKEMGNLDGLVTIIGGKATTCRQMAEKTVDLVCQKLGVKSACNTKDIPLISYREFYR